MSRKYKPEQQKEISNNDTIFTNSNRGLRKKHRNLIKGLLNIKETTLKVQITDKVISISCDKYVDLPSKGKGSVAVSDPYYISISINILKDIGCITSMGSILTQFKDKNLYKNMISYAKITKDRINIESFNNLYLDAVKKFEMSRNINLDILEL